MWRECGFCESGTEVLRIVWCHRCCSDRNMATALYRRSYPPVNWRCYVTSSIETSRVMQTRSCWSSGTRRMRTRLNPSTSCKPSVLFSPTSRTRFVYLGSAGVMLIDVTRNINGQIAIVQRYPHCANLQWRDWFLPCDARSAKPGITIVSRPSVCPSVCL